MEQQEIIYRLSMMEQQMNQLQQQMQALEEGITELEMLNIDLEEIPKSVGKEALAMVGKGIYIKSKIISEELIVNIGEKNFVKKSVGETKKLLEGQIKKLRGIKEDVSSNMEATNKEFMDIIQMYQESDKQ